MSVFSKYFIMWLFYAEIQGPTHTKMNAINVLGKSKKT